MRHMPSAHFLNVIDLLPSSSELGGASSFGVDGGRVARKKSIHRRLGILHVDRVGIMFGVRGYKRFFRLDLAVAPPTSSRHRFFSRRVGLRGGHRGLYAELHGPMGGLCIGRLTPSAPPLNRFSSVHLGNR